MTADREKKRTLTYKRAGLLQGGPLNLQELLSDALKALPDVTERECEVIPGSSTKRVLSGVGATNGMLTAKLMQYTPGQKQQFLERDNATKDYKLDAVSPPVGPDKKIRREFVESILYLAIFKDHVLYIGSQVLGSRHLEDYLNWILRVTGKLPTEEFVLLKDQQSPEAIAQISKHPVDKVQIGGELDFETVEEVPARRKTKTSERVEGYKLLRPIGSSVEAIRALLGDCFSDAPLRAALNRNEVIAYKLELTYSNRKKTDAGFELMQKLAVAGRHFDKDDTRVHLHKGGMLKGDELKLQKSIGIRLLDGGMIEEPDVWVRIHTWLRNAMEKGLLGAS